MAEEKVQSDPRALVCRFCKVPVVSADDTTASDPNRPHFGGCPRRVTFSPGADQ